MLFMLVNCTYNKGSVMKTFLAITTLLFSLSANAFVIDFDELGLTSGGPVGPQLVLPEAVFTQVPDVVRFPDTNTLGYFSGFSGGTNSFPGYICPLESVDGFCWGALLVDFTDPANNLSFTLVGFEPDDDFDISIFNSGGLLDMPGLTSLLPPGQAFVDPVAQLIDLSSYSDVTRLFMVFDGLSGGSGVGLFQTDVPEPGTLGILGVALAALAFIRRKRPV
ncbi:MAG: PEP-CTERM sorting domain-containing protein [Pseudomonadales bacterium]